MIPFNISRRLKTLINNIVRNSETINICDLFLILQFIIAIFLKKCFLSFFKNVISFNFFATVNLKIIMIKNSNFEGLFTMNIALFCFIK